MLWSKRNKTVQDELLSENHPVQLPCCWLFSSNSMRCVLFLTHSASLKYSHKSNCKILYTLCRTLHNLLRRFVIKVKNKTPWSYEPSHKRNLDYSCLVIELNRKIFCYFVGLGTKTQFHIRIKCKNVKSWVPVNKTEFWFCLSLLL